MTATKAYLMTFFLKKESLFIVVNLVSWLLPFWLPVEHAKMLIVLVFALTGWGTQVLPQPLVSFTIIAAIPVLGLGSFSESLSGYAQPFVWLLVSTFILSAALEFTGAGKRIALIVLLKAKGNTSWTVLYVLITVVLLGFLIPTASGRSAMIMPVCAGMIQVMKGEGLTGNFARNVMLGVAFMSSFMSWAIITGSSSSIYAVSAIDSMAGYKWSYTEWLLTNFPIMILLMFCLWLILKKQFPIKLKNVPGGYRYIQQEYESVGKVTRAEWRILSIGLLTLGGWITEPLHGLSVSLIALISAVISCTPVVGVQSWKEASKHISWDVVILFGAGFALADALQRNETADWLATNITHSIPALNPAAAAVLMLLMILIFRLGFANMLAITATFLPITISLSNMWGINPIWLSQIVIIACSFGYFLPFQSPSNLITYSYGYYSEKDLFKAGTVMSLAVIVVVLFSALFYWPLVGLDPVSSD